MRNIIVTKELAFNTIEHVKHLIDIDLHIFNFETNELIVRYNNDLLYIIDTHEEPVVDYICVNLDNLMYFLKLTEFKQLPLPIHYVDIMLYPYEQYVTFKNFDEYIYLCKKLKKLDEI